MTPILERPAASPEPPETEDPPQSGPRRWTRDEYYRLGEMGFFDDERVELLDGEIWTLPPQTPRHFTAAELAAEVLQPAFGSGFDVRRRGPLSLGSDTEPEPDVAIVPGHFRDYDDHHPAPAEVLLLVEVSDATLRKDRTKKVEDYARAGIADYWIVNLVQRQLEVHRDPLTRPSGPLYQTTQLFVPGDFVAPLAAPGSSIAVADLFPPA